MKLWPNYGEKRRLRGNACNSERVRGNTASPRKAGDPTANMSSFGAIGGRETILRRRGLVDSVQR